MRNVLLLNGIIIPLPSTYYPLFNQLLSPSSPFQPPFFFCPHLFALSSAQAEKGEQKQRAQVKIRTYMCVKTAWRDKCAKMECLTNLRTCPSRDRAQKGGDCKRGANNRQWQPAVATPFGQQTNRATVQTIRLNLNNVGHSIYTRFTIAVAITRAITMSNMINWIRMAI